MLKIRYGKIQMKYSTWKSKPHQKVSQTNSHQLVHARNKQPLNWLFIVMF